MQVILSEDEYQELIDKRESYYGIKVALKQYQEWAEKNGHNALELLAVIYEEM